MGKLIVYKASAGSGKTFTLAVEYIKLLIDNPTAYRNILAVTFTNKATEEMKERILSQLYGIAYHDNNSDAYLQRIVEDTGHNENHIRLRAKEALANIIHDYSKFRIETIDSFFQHVMRSLAYELGLNPNMNVELKIEEMIEPAIENLLQQINSDKKLLNVVTSYISDNIDDGKRWNITEELQAFSKNIFDENYIEISKQIRDGEEYSFEKIDEYKRELIKRKDEILSQVERYRDEYDALVEQYGLEHEDFKNGSKKIIFNYFNKIANGDLSDAIRNKTIEACLEDAENWTTKTSKKKDLIISAANDRLIDHMKKTEEFREKGNLILSTCLVSLKNLNKLKLLSRIDNEIRAFNKEKNQILISDTNQLLHRIIQDDDSSFVYEKIGTSIKHIMIDEFQDTSKLQWRNFKILLFEALSHRDNDSLIVGDVKQSIYRWRNSDWTILNDIEENVKNATVVVKELDTNRRSEPNVIGFNNNFFCDFGDKKELEKAYSSVYQKTPKNTETGYVRVECVESKNESEYKEEVLEKVKEQLNRIVGSGIELKDIAILVRVNKDIPIIANYIEKECGYRVVSNEAFRLDSSIAVRLIIDCLKYINDTNDYISIVNIAISYQKHILKRDELSYDYSIDDIIKDNKAIDFVPKQFLDNIQRYRNMPLYDLVEELYNTFELNKIAGQQSYIYTFLDQVVEYLRNNDIDISKFIEHWEEKISSKTISNDNTNGIRIISIHQSKGLEFNTVIIPFCNWKFENKNNKPIIWCQSDHEYFNKLEYIPIEYDSSMRESVYGKYYEKEKTQILVDNINLLYVAFTRACQNLFVWYYKKDNKSNKDEVKEDFSSIDQFIHRQVTLLAEKEQTYFDGIYEKGELKLLPKSRGKQSTTNKLEKHSQPYIIDTYSEEKKIEFKQSNNSKKFIEEENSNFNSEYIDRGKMFHYLFSTITSENDIEKSIDSFIRMGIIKSGEEKKEVLSFVTKAIDSVKNKGWYSGDWQQLNECQISTIENNIYIIKRPDRVMTKGEKAVVIDFKFAKKADKYKKQVREYIDLLKQMGYKDVTGYLWYVDLEEVEEVY